MEEVYPLRSARNILVVLAVGAVLAAGCTGDGGNEVAGAVDSSADRAEPTSSRGSATGDGADRIRIANFAFAPATVRAKVGKRVRWEHLDPGVTHTVSALDGRLRSRELHEGDEFSHRFQTAGTFAYRCAIHPGMRGTVRVGG